MRRNMDRRRRRRRRRRGLIQKGTGRIRKSERAGGRESEGGERLMGYSGERIAG